MMGEEPVIPTPEPKESVEIPEDTPYYLNPLVLNDDKDKASKQEVTCPKLLEQA